jgi:hypothetical protein
MHVALSLLVEAKWTHLIQAEWLRNVLKNRPDLDRAQLERTQALMNLAVPDALVEGFEDWVDMLHLPDPDDRHGLAAAIQAQASVIVTMNLKDFPEEVLEPFGVEAVHPDTFFLRLLKQNPGAIINAFRLQRESMKSPSVPPDQFLQIFERQGLQGTVQWLRPFLVLL